MEGFGGGRGGQSHQTAWLENLESNKEEEEGNGFWGGRQPTTCCSKITQLP